MNVYMLCVSIYIYIYIYRERERCIVYVYIYIYIYIYNIIYIYIYIYIYSIYIYIYIYIYISATRLEGRLGRRAAARCFRSCGQSTPRGKNPHDKESRVKRCGDLRSPAGTSRLRNKNLLRLNHKLSRCLLFKSGAKREDATAPFGRPAGLLCALVWRTRPTRPPSAPLPGESGYYYYYYY